ncbi:hypothetical protein AAC387_Pa07g2837 [Persea americana]
MSTLSSSFGDIVGMVVASDNLPYKWLPSQHASPAPEDEGGGRSRKQEWANHLLQQPIPALSLEIGAGGCEKRGLEMEEWESVLPESALSPNNDQSFCQWFRSDMDDPSLKHLLQGSGGAQEFKSTTSAGDTPQFSASSLVESVHYALPPVSKQQLLSIQNHTNSFDNVVEVNGVDCVESMEGFKEDLIGSEIDELEEGRDLGET